MIKNKDLYLPLREDRIGDIVLSLAEIENVDEFSSLLRNYVSVHYPETEYSYGYDFINSSLEGREDNQLLNGKKSVWCILNFGNIVGYIATTVKDNNCVKINHCVLRPGNYNNGIASGAILKLARFYENLGVFKIYATAPKNHTSACGCLSAAGFSIELTLKKHYSEFEDEIVFSRLLNPQAILIDGKIDKVKPNYIEGHDFFDYSIKPCKHFYFGHKLFGLAFPKRGGAVKLQLITFNVQSSKHLINLSMQFFLPLGKRRLYCLVPVSEKELINGFIQENFEIEGQIQMQLNTDSLVLIAKNF